MARANKTMSTPNTGKVIGLVSSLWYPLNLNEIQKISVQPQYIDWNGYKAIQTYLLYVFVDLTVHKVQKHAYIYHFDITDRKKRSCINLFRHNLPTESRTETKG